MVACCPLAAGAAGPGSRPCGTGRTVTDCQSDPAVPGRRRRQDRHLRRRGGSRAGGLAGLRPDARPAALCPARRPRGLSRHTRQQPAVPSTPRRTHRGAGACPQQRRQSQHTRCCRIRRLHEVARQGTRADHIDVRCAPRHRTDYRHDRGRRADVGGACSLVRAGFERARRFPRPALAPAAATATPGTFIGNGFDACNAPSTAAMGAWMKAAISRREHLYRWRDAGLQQQQSHCQLGFLYAFDGLAVDSDVRRPQTSTCTSFSGPARLTDPTKAATQGRQVADDAAGLSPGAGPPGRLAAGCIRHGEADSRRRAAAAAPLFFERLDAGVARQRLDVRRLRSGGRFVTDLSAQWGTSYQEPDDLWFANWNDLDSIYGDPYVSDSQWSGHRRIHQWHGGATETYGGYSINIDADGVDGQVVGPPGGDCVTYPAETSGPTAATAGSPSPGRSSTGGSAHPTGSAPAPAGPTATAPAKAPTVRRGRRHWPTASTTCRYRCPRRTPGRTRTTR